jgi:electron transfer flavoprotein beta subunit
MNIIVLAKQIPDAEARVEIRADGKKLDIEQKFTTNLFDEYALEEALRIREKHGGKVKVITLGSSKAAEVVRTGIAMGADEGMLLDAEAFQYGDGYATALALSKAVAKESYDVIICGRQALDDDRAEVGQMVAQFLDLPHVGNIVKLDIADNKAVVESLLETGKAVIEVTIPAVFTTQKGLNEPRVPLITGVMKAMKTQIPKVTPEDLGLDAGEVGAAGSKVKTNNYVPPKKRAQVKQIMGEAPEAAVEAVRILIDVERVI